MRDVIRPAAPRITADPEFTVRLGDHYSIFVTINDAPFPVTPSIMKDLRIISNVNMILPTVSFRSTDMVSFLTNEVEGFDEGENTIGDSIRMSIGISDGDSEPEVNNFRIMSLPEITPGKSYGEVSLVGMLDNLKWWKGITTGAFSGNSTEVIKNLSTECGLGFYGPHSFNDNMTWLPSLMNYSEFSRHICRHAWSDDSSCAQMALDVDGVLRYIDLNRLADESPIATAKFLKPVENETDFEILECIIKTNSGVNNFSAAYPGIMVEQDHKGVLKEHFDVVGVKQGAYFDYSTPVSEELRNIKIELAAIQAGNTHRNYNRASYQNFRLLATYGIIAEIYTETVTHIGLMEVVDLDMADQSDGNDQRNYSGTYYVAAKVVGINGNRYFEKLRLVTNNRGLNPSRDMK